MAENSVGFIFDSLWCYTIVICHPCLKNIKERMKTSRVYELSGQPPYSHNFQDKCQPNALSLSSKLAISPKYNCTHLGHAFWYIHTVFLVLAFVKVQNINVFIHVFVKCVFISLALNNEIAEILICKSLLRY